MGIVRVHYDIINGPGIDELLESITSVRQTSVKPLKVTFNLPDGLSIIGVITALEYVESLGESKHKVNFKGVFGGFLFEGFYDDFKKTGYVKPVTTSTQ